MTPPITLTVQGERLKTFDEGGEGVGLVTRIGTSLSGMLATTFEVEQVPTHKWDIREALK